MAGALTLLELAVQGVDGLPSAGRFALRPGFNAVLGGPEAASAFTRTLWALLFSEGTFPGSPSTRAALSLLASDGLTYRFLGAGGSPVTLSRLDPQAGRFEVVTPTGGLSNVLRAWGVPERRLFDALFLLSKYPTPKPAASSLSGPGPATGPKIESKFAELADQMTAAVPTSPEEIHARLRDIEKEDQEAEQIEQLQFQIDGLQQQLFQAEDALKIFDQVAADVTRIDKELSGMPSISEDLVAQVKRLPQLTLKRDDALKRVVDERLELEANSGEETFASLANDRLFLGSIVAGAAFIVIAILASQGSPGARWLALVDIPAFGIAAVMAVQRLSEMRRSQGVGRKLAALQEREVRVQKAFETESREVLALMKNLGVEGVGELEERLAARNAMLERRSEAEEKLKRAEAEDAAEGRRVQRDRLRVQVGEIEAQLTGFGGYRRDRGELKKEQEELKTALANFGRSSGSYEGALDDGPPKDEAAGLLRLAGEVFAMSPAMVLQTVRERLAQYMGAFSNRQFTGANFGPDGGLLLLSTAGASVAFAGLPPAEQHATLTALRLCLAERHLTGHRLFLLSDERADGLDDARRDLCAKLMKGLTRYGQVFWIGERGVSVADNQVSLG